MLYLSIAGVTFRLEGPPAILAEVRTEFGSLLELAEIPEGSPLLLEWDGLGWAMGVEHFPCAEEAAATIAPLVLARACCREVSSLRILHGNGVVLGGRAMLLIGDSGAGKSTLSRELLALDPEASFLAEDWLLLDAERHRIHRFPRAATIQPDDGGAARAEPMRLYPGTEISAENAAIFLLGRRDANPPEQKDFILSHGDDELAAMLEKHWRRRVTMMADGCYARLHVEIALTSAERVELAIIARRRGVLVLGPVRGGDREWVRGASPIVEECILGAAIPELMKHYVVSEDLPPAGLEFLGLAGALQGARTFRLAPGGGATKTAEAMLHAIG